MQAQNAPTSSIPAGAGSPAPTHRGGPRRFMRRLSIRVKLWSSAVILLIPLLGLAVFYVKSLSATLYFTQTEQRGALLSQPLVQIADEAGQRAALVVGHLKKGAAGAPLDELDHQIETQLASIEKFDATYGNPATHTKLQTLEKAWESLKNAKPASVSEVAQAHSAVTDAANALKGQATTDWLIILDPELVSYNLLDVSTGKLADAEGFLSDARIGLQSLYVNGEFQSGVAQNIVTALALLSDRLAGAKDELTGSVSTAADRPALAQAIGALGDGGDTRLAGWITQVREELQAARPRESTIQTLSEASAALPAVLTQSQAEVQRVADQALSIRHNGQAAVAYFALGGSAVLVIFAMLLLRALITRISGAVHRLLYILVQITSGNFENRVDESGMDEFSRLFAGMATMQRTLKNQIESERALAQECSRIRSALDKTSASVMLADDNLNIIYTNEAAQRLFREAQDDMRRDLPALNAEKILGSNVDIFHKTPSRQRNLLSKLTTTHVADLRISTRSMRLTLNPVLASDGTRIGTVLEWRDRTQEVMAEEEVNGIVRRALDGHLDSRVGLDNKSGFIQVLGKGLNELLDNMAAMVRQMQTAAAEVARGADEISQGNANLSQRTEEQSSSLEETASSMEQMTSTVKQNADNAGQASQLATAARDQAEKGGTVVGKAVAAMTGINESSRKIADIIGVIDEIAFQTNLLALNAAVEAARAGEQGRGFAVVASEVRNLAGRSATAAKEIKELIQDSVRRVDEGSTLVAQSGQTLEQIVAAVKKVSDIIAEIAAASHEQSDGIDQVNKAVMQLDEMTQQNAALVEQATAASHAMAEQARGMNNLMANYHLVGVAGATGAAPITKEAEAVESPATVAATAPRTERRGAQRPWTKTESARAPARPKAEAVNGSDSDWKEF